jgi:hypothetical protein
MPVIAPATPASSALVDGFKARARADAQVACIRAGDLRELLARLEKTRDTLRGVDGERWAAGYIELLEAERNSLTTSILWVRAQLETVDAKWSPVPR